MTVLVEGWEVVDGLDDLAVGGRMEVTLASGRIVLVLRSEAGYFACCADCPHQDTPLVEGAFDGTVLTCPVHFWQWDVRTGEAMGIAELPLPTYELRRSGEHWLIRGAH